MEKAKVTARWIKESYNKRLSVGYCAMQFLLKYEDPVYYTCGSSGWNSDNYYFPEFDLLVSTGYRPVFGTTKADYELIESFDKKAREIEENYGTNALPYDQKKVAVKILLVKFLQEVTK